MTTQDELFHEDWRDSLRHLVKALGGVEVAGKDLFPNKTVKAAGSWLSDCLNPERPAKLDLEEVEVLLRMGRENGINTGMHFLCDGVGYDRPHPSTPKSPKSLLLEKQVALAKESAQIQREIDRLDAVSLTAAGEQ